MANLSASPISTAAEAFAAIALAAVACDGTGTGQHTSTGDAHYCTNRAAATHTVIL
jgi:hypothetical protein